MIDPRELRIGNYIYWNIPKKNGVFHKVEAILESTLHTIPISLGKHKDYDPIPITEELLIKAGFNQEIKIGNAGEYRVYSFDFIVYNTSTGWWVFGWHLDQDIKGFHHLQNIVFDLSGKELNP
jgi:hypothetical protein